MVSDANGFTHWLTGSLTRRVLTWMLAVSMLPLLIMAYQGYHCAGQALVEQSQQHLDSVLGTRLRLVEEWLVSRSREVRLLDKNTSVSLLDTVRNGDPAYDWIAVFDAAGQATAASGDAPALTESARAQVAPRGEVSVLREPGGHGLLLARALESGGWVAARLDAGRGLDALLRDQSGLGEGGRIYVTTENLVILSDPFGGTEGRRADPAVLHASMGHTAQAHGFFHLLPYHPETIRSAAEIPGTGWLLVVEADPAQALAWLKTLRIRATVTGLVTLIVLVLVTVWIARMLGQPLRELGRVAQRIRGGRTEERLGPLRGPEAEAVRQAFNQMLDELREKQRELVRSSTLASVGELSSSIVHEMRNPLSSIKMNLQALRRRADGDAAYHELGEIATEQVQRLEGMLDELLKYGRPVELHLEVVPFKALAETAVALVGDSARAKHIGIDIEDRLEGYRLNVDREQMTRALTNLLSNAIQAAPEDSRIRLAGHAGSGRIRIEVDDSGPGLPAEAHERLFKPFFTTKPNGTGLGLANVKKIVELHNGAVAAQNRPEGGARFTIDVPESALTG